LTDAPRGDRPDNPTDRGPSWIGVALGPVALVLVRLAPPPGLTPEAEAMLGVLALVLVWWLTEAVPLPVTALAGPGLAVAFGVASPSVAFGGFADPTVMLLIGSFILVAAIQTHQVDRRLGYRLMSSPWVGESTSRAVWALALTSVLVSAWINNSAAAAMLLPAALSIGNVAAERVGASNAHAYQTALLLALAYGVSIGGMITPVGTPTNLLGLALLESATGERIGFANWVVLGGAIALVLLGVLYGLLMFFCRPEVRTLPGQRAAAQEAGAALGPWSRNERLVGAVCLMTVVLWIAPGMVALAMGDSSRGATWLRERLPESVVAVLMSSLLFVLPGDRRGRLLTWKDVSALDWGTVVLLGGGAALGRLTLETGLAAELGENLLTGGWLDRAIVLTLAGTLLAALLSELASNTAAVNLVVPVLLGVVAASGHAQAPAAVAATLGASIGFMLPMATPPNALAYGSGLVPRRSMLVVGGLLDVAGVATIALVVSIAGRWVL
jgi:sodium-dependent dicarboxylate transporter 2/3/5